MGKNPSGERQRQFARLPNYGNGKFSSLEGAGFKVMTAPWGRILREYRTLPASVTPSQPVPSVRTDLKDSYFAQPTVVWFGHSSYLIQHGNFNLLVDPVFSGYAAPFSFMVNAFAGANAYQTEDLPPIDVLLLTHDHYDHLDYETMGKLRGRVGRVVTALGLGAHLEYWGWDPGCITELNWGDTTEPYPGVTLTATPARHQTGRGPRTCRTLWASFALQLQNHRLFLGGDSGYGSHFATIGNQYGPFDLALLDNGQYNPSWATLHALPHQTVRAAQELRVHTLMPVHWAKFALAFHPWNEPVQKLLEEADRHDLRVTVPRIGEPYALGTPPHRTVWWDFS